VIVPESREAYEIYVETFRMGRAAWPQVLVAQRIFFEATVDYLQSLVALRHAEVAILGLHRISPRPAVHDGEVVVRDVGWISCTFDHRVVDGARASEFLLAVVGRLESDS
jgi:hypothetical protein